MAQQIDYAALAAQAGGKPAEAVDYAALAKAAGGTPEPAKEPEQEKSVSGFLGNLVSSTGNLIKDSALGLKDAAVFFHQNSPLNPDKSQMMDPRQALRIIRALPGAIAEGVSNRYGSLEKAVDTLYNDPAGVLADASAVLSLGAGAAAKAPRIARVIRGAESAINPLRVAEPIAQATEIGTAAAMRPLLAPPKNLVRQSRAPLEIERTALKTGAVTEGSAGRKLGKAVARTTKAADDATRAGTMVPRTQVAQFPKTLDEVQNLTPNVRELDDLARVEAETIASLPAQITPSELLTRRRALDKAVDSSFRAEERGGYIRGIQDKGRKELAGNMREALRQVSPEVRESDDLARRLGAVKSAIAEANMRPKGIPMSAALGAAGGGFFVGGPAAAALGGTIGVGRTFPQIPLALGSIPVRGTAAVAAATADPISRQGLLLAALLERLSREQN